jgi:hypothetical protein
MPQVWARASRHRQTHRAQAKGETMTTTRMLIVDDERLIAQALRRRVAGLGYTVVGLAASGEPTIQVVGSWDKHDQKISLLRLHPNPSELQALTGFYFRTHGRTDPVFYFTGFAEVFIKGITIHGNQVGWFASIGPRQLVEQLV